ncbi:hypothetical protein EBZ39_06935 [bacterium]|nr:hypothetical protein [bacterium]
MKQIVSNYSYSPTTNVVTLTGVNIEQDQLLLVVAPQVGRTMYNFASGVTGTVSAGVNTRVTLNASTASLTTTSPLVIYYDDQLTNNTVTISSLPAISGTVTANINWLSEGSNPIRGNGDGVPDYGFAIAFGKNNYGSAIVSDDYPLPISGTVNGSRTFVDANGETVSGFLTVGGWDVVNARHAPIPLNDGATGVKVCYDTADNTPFRISGTVTVGNSVTVGNTVTVAGTVTANSSNGALTTRFGTPTTANTAFATSAVTNASRKYLLIQNVTTASNVITVGIGFTPTTTQGIQLTAGAGITFESSYIPTGAVYVLSSVTASNFTVLEA